VLSRRGASEAGRLRLRLVLEKAAATPDGAGGATLAWSAAATVFADVMPVRAEERQGGEGVSDTTLHRIVIRHRGDVSAGDRFRLGERLFAIKSVTDRDEDGRFLVCLAEEEGRP
jgi:SPP1 family predicted phage head-tail adaptor